MHHAVTRIEFRLLLGVGSRIYEDQDTRHNYLDVSLRVERAAS
jgi:hypothetical protein